MQTTKTSSSDKSHIVKKENYIDQKFDHAALNHLKPQLIMEIKNDLDNNNNNNPMIAGLKDAKLSRKKRKKV